MKKEYIELIIAIGGGVLALLTAILGYTMKNKNSVRNNKSQNINNSSNVNIQENNYGVNNRIDK